MPKADEGSRRLTEGHWIWTEARVARGFSIGAGAQYMDSIFRNATNTAEVPSYWLVNAMAAYDVSRVLTLRLNVNNLGRCAVRRSRRRRPLHPRPGALRLHQRGIRFLMLLQIPGVLTAPQVREARALLDAAEWVDGRVTAGHQSARAKNNEQIPESHPAARQVGETVVAALARNPLFRSAALPLHVFPPLFNRYTGGQSFGSHVDNAVRQVAGTALRTDLSATLFLSEPDEYDGGELVIEDTFGVQSVKLAAGHLILYPASSLHHVRPVTRGGRVSSFFWIQSMVRDDGERTLLFDLGLSIQRLGADYPEHASVLQLTGVYHNLLRRWAEL